MRPARGREPLEQVELTATVLETVADLIGESEGFEELVYRESELDALFSVADQALRTSRGSPMAVRAADVTDPPLRSTDMRRVRDLVARAHDLLHDDQRTLAAALLREAAQLL
jgi:hypothetical protein